MPKWCSGLIHCLSLYRPHSTKHYALCIMLLFSAVFLVFYDPEVVTPDEMLDFNDTYDDKDYPGYWEDDGTVAQNLIQDDAGKVKSEIKVDKPKILHAKEDKTLMIDDHVANEVMKKVKILCWITTRKSAFETKIKAINATWARRCDKKLYVITGDVTKELENDVLSLKVPDGRGHLTAKTVQAQIYIHNHFLKRFDWFLKADDDTYIVMENLKYLLSRYNHRKPVYLGHLFKKYSKHGYMSGGAGYVLSRKALGMLVKKRYRKKGKCREDGGDEDVEIAKCLQSLNIFTHNTYDKYGRESFLPFAPIPHVAGPEPSGLAEWDRHVPKIGKDCCSQLLISFHYVKPDLMQLVEHLLYRTSVYGRKVSETGLQKLFHIGPVPPLNYIPK